MAGARGRGGLRLVLFGAPGVGKGTQAAALKELTGLPHIATGDMLRTAMQAGTPAGREAKAIVESGALVPDALVGRMMEERLARPDARDGFLLDGFPRTLAQADLLDRVLAERGQRLDRVINLAVPEPEIIDRLTGRRVCAKCGATYHVRYNRPRAERVCDACGGALEQRADDAPHAIAERLRVYHEQTAPLVARYQRAGVLSTIDGRGERHEVLERIAREIPGLRG